MWYDELSEDRIEEILVRLRYIYRRCREGVGDPKVAFNHIQWLKLNTPIERSMGWRDDSDVWIRCLERHLRERESALFRLQHTSDWS